jgi:glutamate-1-semialdehyde 2,1-aminomutase
MFVAGMLDRAKQNNIAMTSNQVGGMFGLFFSDEDKIENFEQVSNCNIDQFNHFFHQMLSSGVNLAPSAYEAGFLSSAHTEADINETLDAASKAFSTLS